MKSKTKIALIISSILFALAFMTFGSYGSFNPSEIGFYTSIGAGVVWFLLMYLVLRKSINKREG